MMDLDKPPQSTIMRRGFPCYLDFSVSPNLHRNAWVFFTCRLGTSSHVHIPNNKCMMSLNAPSLYAGKQDDDNEKPGGNVDDGNDTGS